MLARHLCFASSRALAVESTRKRSPPHSFSSSRDVSLAETSDVAPARRLVQMDPRLSAGSLRRLCGVVLLALLPTLLSASPIPSFSSTSRHALPPSPPPCLSSPVQVGSCSPRPPSATSLPSPEQRPPPHPTSSPSLHRRRDHRSDRNRIVIVHHKRPHIVIPIVYRPAPHRVHLSPKKPIIPAPVLPTRTVLVPVVNTQTVYVDRTSTTTEIAVRPGPTVFVPSTQTVTESHIQVQRTTIVETVTATTNFVPPAVTFTVTEVLQPATVTVTVIAPPPPPTEAPPPPPTATVEPPPEETEPTEEDPPEDPPEEEQPADSPLDEDGGDE